MKSTWFDSPLGPMLAIGDQTHLHLLEFAGRRHLDKELGRLGQTIPDETPPILSIQKELDLYFKGQLKTFKTPVCIQGTPFQKAVWQALMNIPFGETRSYLEQATAMGRPKSFRAVANANGRNQLAILIPCHRVINHNGGLGGYGGGLENKKWLLAHEAEFEHAHR